MEPRRFEQYARLAVIALLVVGSFLVLQPFLAAILFAVVLCMSTWPAYAWLRDRWGGRSSLAALAFVLVLLVAHRAAGRPGRPEPHRALGGHRRARARPARPARRPSQLPAFIRDLPLVGPWLDQYWQALMQQPRGAGGARQALRRTRPSASSSPWAARSGKGWSRSSSRSSSPSSSIATASAPPTCCVEAVARLAGAEHGRVAAHDRAEHGEGRGLRPDRHRARAGGRRPGRLPHRRRARRVPARGAHLHPVARADGTGARLGRRRGLALRAGPDRAGRSSWWSTASPSSARSTTS